MKKINNFWLGFILGLLLPLGFIWLYLNQFYPQDLPFFEIIKRIYPSRTLGNLLMLSFMPDMVFMFICYKTDSFRIASGFFVGGVSYFIASFFML
jgi:hypothetical protein